MATHGADETSNRELEQRSHRIAGAVYGTILATSVVAAAGADTSQLYRTLIIVAVTSLVFWLAHVYSQILAARMLLTRGLRREEMRAIAVSEWPMLQSSWPILLVLLLGVLGIIDKSTASYAAVWAGIVALLIYGFVAARQEQLSFGRQVLATLINVAFGLAILTLKILVH
jgi:hypothetical protein